MFILYLYLYKVKNYSSVFHGFLIILLLSLEGQGRAQYFINLKETVTVLILDLIRRVYFSFVIARNDTDIFNT